MSFYSQIRAKDQAKGEARARGGAAHSDEAADRRLFTKLIAEHDQPKRRKRGGAVEGGAPANRLDRRGRGSPSAADVYAQRPGPARTTVTHPKEKYVNVDKEPLGRKRGGRTIINIHAGARGQDQGQLMQAKQEGAKMGAMAVIQKLKGAGAAPGAPPPGMGAPPPGGMPPPGAGAPPMVPPPGMPMRKHGGLVPAKAVKAAKTPPSLDEQERNKAETGHKGLIPVKAHQRRKAGGGV